MSCLLGQLTDGLVGVDREYEANPGWVVGRRGCVREGSNNLFFSLCSDFENQESGVLLFNSYGLALFVSFPFCSFRLLLDLSCLL